MPFGYYMAEICEKPKKPPKPKKAPKVKPKKEDLPKPPAKKEKPVIPVVEKPKTPVIHDIPPDVPEVMVDNIMNISILVAGRSVSEALDLVTGIEKNTNVVTEERGMSLFSTDSQTASDLFSRQTKLKRLAENNSLKYENVISDDSESITVTLQLSRAGFQSFSVQANFICTSIAQAAAGLTGCHCVWVLTDNSFYTQTPEGGAQADSVISAAKSANIPVFVILTEFEQYGMMYAQNNMCMIDPNLYTKLTNMTGSAIGDAAKNTQMIPVQVYGGQFFRDNPAAKKSNRYGYEEYTPCGCHIPLLMTIQKINTGDKFADNELITDIKLLNAAQKSAFLQNGVKIEM